MPEAPGSASRDLSCLEQGDFTTLSGQLPCCRYTVDPAADDDVLGDSLCHVAVLAASSEELVAVAHSPWPWPKLAA